MTPRLDRARAVFYRRRPAAARRFARAPDERAWVAQLVEQRIENPRVGGSIPPPGTIVFIRAAAPAPDWRLV